MAPEVSRIEISQNIFFDLYLSKDWAASNNPTKILPYIRTIQSDDKMKLYSISHCKELGGFSIGAHVHGFDIEEFQRINKKTVARVCNRTDLDNAPSPGALWVTKESSFKCLSNYGQDITVLSQICDIQFLQNSKDSWSFQALRPHPVNGLVWLSDRLIMGLAYIST